MKVYPSVIFFLVICEYLTNLDAFAQNILWESVVEYIFKFLIALDYFFQVEYWFILLMFFI